jgi:allantoate deiminase
VDFVLASVHVDEHMVAHDKLPLLFCQSKSSASKFRLDGGRYLNILFCRSRNESQPSVIPAISAISRTYATANRVKLCLASLSNNLPADLSAHCRAAADRVMQRCDDLAACSEDPTNCTRTFCSPAMVAAHDILRSWMAAAGLTTRLDPVANLIGHFAAPANCSDRVLLIGSHLDTVVNAGRYDGPLGVLMGVGLVEVLNEAAVQLPFAIDVIGFCEEEGIRYRTPFIGSRAVAGTLDPALLERVDEQAVSMQSAIDSVRISAPDCVDVVGYDRQQVIGYIEPHIEQGPVLEKEDLPVGIVETIAGQTRAAVRFIGRAGHAGTVPMSLRRDALTGAAQWIGQVEEASRKVPGAVATVAQLEVNPNISNVIASDVHLRLDLRHRDDNTRGKLVAELFQVAEHLADHRGLEFHVEWQEQFAAVQMDAALSARLREAAVDAGVQPRMLTSGAGHDAAILATALPSAMLFLRCRGGISHHPDESVRTDDVAVALEVLVRMVDKLAADYTLR